MYLTNMTVMTLLQLCIADTHGTDSGNQHCIMSRNGVSVMGVPL